MPGFLASIDLSEPGRYLHWNVFTISESNLVLIVVMAIIFGLALIVPFPSHKASTDADALDEVASGSGDEPTRPPAAVPAADSGSAMWTARLRRRMMALLPPERLIPDRQPAYVASWVYVFGIATLSALGVVIVSGFAIALGGVDWWHTNPVGHFFNSLHLWSVEIFMAFMVIHLWGKFWMAAWRGRRGRTWVTGVLAFVASVGEAFTGYLSQQNFDSQWIATNGKDAFNSAGVGAFFNLMNFGQMLLWHVVLFPLLLVTLVGAHVLLVRVRGVAHPIDADPAGAEVGGGRSARRAQRRAEAVEWRGPTRRYDILKEGAIAAMVAIILTVLLAGLLSSPDIPPLTIRTWAQAAPADFLGTAASELAGTSETSHYGPPYNYGSGNVQRIGVSWQKLAGVRQPIVPGRAFVVAPLTRFEPNNPALSAFRIAPASEQRAWANAYLAVLPHVVFHGKRPTVPAADDGPVPSLLATELDLARSGALDADLIANQSFYGTNFTGPLLFLEDGSYFASRAHAEHLTGTQWGVMNETGSFPGQPWLWLYQLWYQLPGFRNSANVDLIAIYLTGVATILLLAVPFIPGLRDIPRKIPIHRLIWRSWYRRSEAGTPEARSPSPPGT